MMYKVRLVDAWIRGEVVEEVRVIQREQQFREGDTLSLSVCLSLSLSLSLSRSVCLSFYLSLCFYLYLFSLLNKIERFPLAI